MVAPSSYRLDDDDDDSKMEIGGREKDGNNNKNIAVSLSKLNHDLNLESPNVKRLIRGILDSASVVSEGDDASVGEERSLQSKDVRRLAEAISNLSSIMPQASSSSVTSKIQTVDVSDTTSVTSELTSSSRYTQQPYCSTTPTTGTDTNKKSFLRLSYTKEEEDDEEEGVQVISDRKLSLLASKLMKRKHGGVPKKYSRGTYLVIRLVEIFTFPMDMVDESKWFWEPLYHALLKGDKDLVNVSITDPDAVDDIDAKNNDSDTATYTSKSMPLLSWLCQWKYLKFSYGWEGNHDIVSLLLGAGADPNITVSSNKHGAVSPIFFAVKYGCLETIKLLVQHGADLTTKDSTGITCLWNALIRPEPEIIRYLLEEANSATIETLPSNDRRKKKHDLTPVDYLVDLQWNLGFPQDSQQYPISWYILGEPSEEDIIYTLIEFGKRGITLTPHTITHSLINMLLRDEDLPIPNFGVVKERLKRLVNFMIGRYLPPSLVLPKDDTVLSEESMKSVNEEEEDFSQQALQQPQERGDSTTCSTSVSNGSHHHHQSTIRLYNGHELSARCILERINNNKMSCPISHQKLCLDLIMKGENSNSYSLRQESLNETYGKDWDGCYAGPKALTYYQLLTECKARGVPLAKSDLEPSQGKQEKFTTLLNEIMTTTEYTGDKKFDFIPPSSIESSKIMSSTLRPITNGAVAIPIVVKGIPIMAYLSMTSTVTLLSPEFVNLFGLKKMHDLQSNKFLTNVDDPHHTHTMVDEFRFHLIEKNRGDDGIEVCLRNALESPLLPDCVGVQLGLDFLRSGAWCVINAAIRQSGNTKKKKEHKSDQEYITIDGYGHTSISTPIYDRRKRNELRYYLNDGGTGKVETVKLKLFHFLPFDENDSPNSNNYTKKNDEILSTLGKKRNNDWVNLQFTQKDMEVSECHWCCRVFPDTEKLICSGCNSTTGGTTTSNSHYYCTFACLDAANEAQFALKKEEMMMMGPPSSLPFPQKNNNNNNGKILDLPPDYFTKRKDMYASFFYPTKKIQEEEKEEAKTDKTTQKNNYTDELLAELSTILLML